MTPLFVPQRRFSIVTSAMPNGPSRMRITSPVMMFFTSESSSSGIGSRQPFDFVVNFPKCRGRHLGSDLGSDSQVTLPLEIDHGGTHAVRVTVLAAQVLHQPRAEIAAQYRSDDLHPDEIGMCAGEEQTPYAQRGLHGVGPFDETIGFAAGSRKIGCGAAVGTGEFFGQGADALQLLLPDAAAAYDQTVFGRIESAVE